MFHYLVEDIPHALTSIAVIAAGRDHALQCGEDPTIAKISLAVSLGSIVIGIISKTMQHLTIIRRSIIRFSRRSNDDEDDLRTQFSAATTENAELHERVAQLEAAMMIIGERGRNE